MIKVIKQFLNKCNVVFDDFNQLDGMNIPRETFLSKEVYENVTENKVLVEGEANVVLKGEDTNWKNKKN